MITGRVANRHALLPVIFRLSGQPDFALEFVVDAGFTDYLTLPPEVVAALKLPFLHKLPVNLADDSDVEISVHGADILWHGLERSVRVFATGRRPLLGTALLDGYELVAQFREEGLVTVDAM